MRKRKCILTIDIVLLAVALFIAAVHILAIERPYLEDAVKLVSLADRDHDAALEAVRGRLLQEELTAYGTYTYGWEGLDIDRMAEDAISAARVIASSQNLFVWALKAKERIPSATILASAVVILGISECWQARGQ